MNFLFTQPKGCGYLVVAGFILHLRTVVVAGL